MSRREVQLDGVLNFRDVGKTVNQFLGENRLREGLFFRSARLDNASPDDATTLRDILGITTVTDLRTNTEHLESIAKFEAAQQSPNPPLTPLRITGLEYHDIKLTGRAFERYILSQLSWWGFFKFFLLYWFGYRIPAVRIIAEEFMIPRGLGRLGLDTLDKSGKEVYEALSLYADPQSLPNLVHCTHGKDRTGLICALVLMILDVPQEAIEHDYFLTKFALGSSADQMVAEVQALGLPRHFASTVPEMIEDIAWHLKKEYGGLNAYLDKIGFTKDKRAKVRENLLYKPHQAACTSEGLKHRHSS